MPKSSIASRTPRLLQALESLAMALGHVDQHGFSEREFQALGCDLVARDVVDDELVDLRNQLELDAGKIPADLRFNSDDQSRLATCG